MIILFLTIFVILIFFYFGKYKRRYDLANKINGPKGLPLLGYVKIFQLSLEDQFNHLIELQKKYKSYYKIWLGSEIWFVCYEPKIIEKILTNQKLVKANDYKFLKPWLGNGLLTNEGRSWFLKRKTITPAFHFNILQDFVEVFVRQADILVHKLYTQQIEDIFPHLVLCTFDIICETAMGIKSDTQTDMDSKYSQAIKGICHITHKRMFNPFLDNDFVFKLTKYYKPFKNYLEIVREETQKIIEKHRKQLNNSFETLNHQENENDFDKKRKKLVLLDILLKATIDGKPLTDEEIHEEVNTFTFAGHDTTSSTLGFLLHNIAKYPNVQMKIYQEIKDIFGESNSTEEININNLNKLKYLDLTIKESMRMYCTIPFIGRQLLEECEIGGIQFPENTNLSIWVYGLCHRDDIFPEPDKFIPERFDINDNVANDYTINSKNENVENKRFHPFAYIPFSAGHRNCIGQKFALLEMKTIIVKILQNFEITLKNPNEELILYTEIVLKSKNGIQIKFNKR